MVTNYVFRLPFRAVVLTVLCVQFLIMSMACSLAISQDPAPDETWLQAYCIKVQCEGSSTETILKGVGNTQQEAQQDAQDRAAALCAPHGYTISEYPIPPRVCELIEVELSHAKTQTTETRQATLAGRWLIRGYLCYCDGSTSLTLVTSGSTRSEAIQKAREALCLMKDPCKRAYLKYCTLETPLRLSPQCPPCHPLQSTVPPSSLPLVGVCMYAKCQGISGPTYLVYGVGSDFASAISCAKQKAEALCGASGVARLYPAPVGACDGVNQDPCPPPIIIGCRTCQTANERHVMCVPKRRCRLFGNR